MGISSVFPGFITSTRKFTSRWLVLVYKQSKLEEIRRKLCELSNGWHRGNVPLASLSWTHYGMSCCVVRELEFQGWEGLQQWSSLQSPGHDWVTSPRPQPETLAEPGLRAVSWPLTQCSFHSLHPLFLDNAAHGVAASWKKGVLPGVTRGESTAGRRMCPESDKHVDPGSSPNFHGTREQLLSLSGSLLPHLQNESSDLFLMKLLWGLNEIKWLNQPLKAQRKHS